MELTTLEKEKYEETYRSILIICSIVFLLINFIGSYFIREEIRQSAIDSVQEYGVSGDGQEFYNNMDKKLHVEPYLIYFVNTFKFTSLAVLIILLIKLYPKHWLSYSLLIIAGIILFSFILCVASSGVFEFDNFIFYLNRLLLYLSLPFFIWSLNKFSHKCGYDSVEHYRRLEKIK